MGTMDTENQELRSEFIKKLNEKGEKFNELTEKATGLKQEEKGKLFETYITTSTWTLLGSMEKNW